MCRDIGENYAGGLDLLRVYYLEAEIWTLKSAPSERTEGDQEPDPNGALDGEDH